jgi:uncharacterized OsmC-like protein
MLFDMDGDELRKLQAPLKERYKTEPSAARITLHARGEVDAAKLICNVVSRRAGSVAGLHPATGGSGAELCSGDMLLEALVACAGVTLAAVSTSMGIALAKAAVVAEGVLDFRGTLGVDRNAPVGFESIRVSFELATEAPEDKVKKLVELTERYCVVLQTLAKPPKIEASIARPRD